MEVTLRMERPLVLYGYFSLPENILKVNEDTKSHTTYTHIPNPSFPTYVNINLAIDPVIEYPEPNDEAFYDGVED